MKDLLLFIFSLPMMLFGQKPEQVTPPTRVSIILGGDVMLGRSVMGTDPFLEIGDFLASADITFVNLENPVIKNCPKTNSGMIFCTNLDMLQKLVSGGVDIVNLANNHTLNYGQKGFEDSKLNLENSGIDFTGDKNLATREVNGTKFGFLGFEKSQQGNPQLTSEEAKLISDSNTKVDVLVVAMHWGVEYQDTALPGVQKLAHQLVDLGADVVVGHHPHWVQNMEKINGAPVYYSLGNLVFDQMWSEETKKGLLVKLTFEGNKIVEEELVNTYIEKLGQPKII